MTQIFEGSKVKGTHNIVQKCTFPAEA